MADWRPSCDDGCMDENPVAAIVVGRCAQER
jgi:hypothetical protein